MLVLAPLLLQAVAVDAAPATQPPARHMVQDGCAPAAPGEVVVCASGRREESPHRLPRLSEEAARHEGLAPIMIMLADGVVLATTPVEGVRSVGAGIGIKIGF